MKILGDSKTYSMQIEHIISQNTEKTLDYKKYGFDDLDDFETYKNSFGNLIPLESSINSSVSDKSLAYKQDEYKKSAIFYNQRFANSSEFLNFSKEKIIEENRKFKDWAKDYFSIFLPKE
ncbi:HNH endonuclease family protein [Campylobacter lanienae]|uniref:HNH endonuclease family protein n=1 Tax=Campylobacter lanienae TaxID=75658 RepID=UPI000BB44A43|nr:HNH endonuclease family protein [Campylobacter lanienae]